MNTRLTSFLASLAALLTAISAADIRSLIGLLPPDIAGILAVSLPAVATVAHALKALAGKISGHQIKVLALFILPGIAYGACLVGAVSSCALPGGWQLDLQTPYGDAITAPDGAVFVAPKPIVIPAK